MEISKDYRLVIYRYPHNTDTGLYGNGVLLDSQDNIIFSFKTLENSKKYIPTGDYTISYTYSPKFNRKLFIVNNVPKMRGIRLHPANWQHELKGCIAFGINHFRNVLYSSNDTFNNLYQILDTTKNYSLTIKQM